MKRKALALLSGGLDSLLAAKLILEQGIDVEGINFFTGFTKISPAEAVAKQLQIKLHVVDVVDAYKNCVMIKPKYGYGANINPCLDCKIFMVQEALKWMQENHFDFLLTGEVVGQRPMSQRKDTMPIVAHKTNDLLLRPLCAKHLPPTLPEREGWVNRELLGSISGRNRKPQFELAAQFGFTEFPQPGGGCLLTDVGFAKRMRDLWRCRNSKDYTFEEIKLLRVGRHLRFSPEFKLIVGRDHEENELLEQYQKIYPSLRSVSHVGPLVLIVNNEAEKGISNKNLELAAQITAYFGKGRRAEQSQIEYLDQNGTVIKMQIKALSEVMPEWYL